MTFAIAAARYVYGFESIDLDARRGPPPTGPRGRTASTRDAARAAGLPAAAASSMAVKARSSPARKTSPPRSRAGTWTSAWASRSAMIRCWLSLWSSATTTGSSSPSIETTGRPARIGARCSRRSRMTYCATPSGAGGEVVVLLLVEVRPEAVDDEQADEAQRDRDDRDEGEGQAALEGLRREAVGHRRQRSANAYPTPRMVWTKAGWVGSSSSLSRRWLTWTLIVFSSWSRAS